MRQSKSSILKFLFVIFATFIIVACTTTMNKNLAQSFGIHEHKKASIRHKIPVNPTTGLGDPKKVKQYQKVTLNLWQVMAANFNLPDETSANPEVKKQIDWFMSHPKYLAKVTSQAGPYLYYIYQQVQARNLPAELALMPMVESAYNPFAINSGSGAAGLWQMMPGTASGFGLHVDWWYDGRRDVSASTNAALDYLAYLGDYFNGDWLLAIGAYDTGEGSIQQAIEHNERHGIDTDFWSLHLPKETQAYVPKVLALATILKYPQTYPINLPDIPNAPYLSEVDIGSQIDLHQAAKMAGMTLQELTALNSGYNRWATDPNGPFKLLLPVDKAQQFQEQLTQLMTTNKQITWYRVVAKKGETIDAIALQYQTTPQAIMKANKLTRRKLKAGQTLLIPNSAAPAVDTASTSDNATTADTQSAADNATTANSDNDTAANDNDETIESADDEDQYVGESINNLPSTNVVHHTVAKGETLASIAKIYHVSVRALEFWNQLNDAHVTPGSDIVVWPPKYKASAVTTSVTTYKVKKHDTVSSIARKFHISAKQLVSSNHIKHNHLKPGQVLHITVKHSAAKQQVAKTHSSASKQHHQPKSPTHSHKSQHSAKKIAQHKKVASHHTSQSHKKHINNQ